jgi:hypothetical protein
VSCEWTRRRSRPSEQVTGVCFWIFWSSVGVTHRLSLSIVLGARTRQLSPLGSQAQRPTPLLVFSLDTIPARSFACWQVILNDRRRERKIRNPHFKSPNSSIKSSLFIYPTPVRQWHPCILKRQPNHRTHRMSKSSTATAPKISHKSAWSKGPPTAVSTSASSSRPQSPAPSSANPANATHSRRPSTLSGQAVPIKDSGVSVPKNNVGSVGRSEQQHSPPHGTCISNPPLLSQVPMSRLAQ